MSKKSKFSEKPFCELCVNSDEGMSFSTADIVQELKWVAECAKTGTSPLTQRRKTVDQYLKDRIEEMREDEKNARGCDGCEEEKEREPVKVEFT